MEFTFKLSEETVQIVLNAIAKEPLGEVIKAYNEIQSQASEQLEKR